MSVKKDDPGYFKYAREFRAFLDGEQIDQSHTADEELGKIWVNDIERFKEEVKKNPWAIYDKDDNIINDIDLHSKELTGKVEIRRVSNG